MDVLVDSLYLVVVIASLVFSLGLVLALGFVGSRFYKFINFLHFVFVLLGISSWLFESIIPDELSKWIDVMYPMWISAYFAAMFLSGKLIEKKLGKMLFGVREYNRLLVNFSSFLLVIGLFVFLSSIDDFDSASMVERTEMASSLVFFVCLAVFPTLTLVNRLEVREHGVVFLNCRKLSEMAIVKKKNIESLVLDSPRSLLKMTYKTKKDEIKEVGAIVKASCVGRLVAILNQFYPNLFG